MTRDGAFFKVNGLELVPRPVQAPVPIHIASATAETVALAAQSAGTETITLGHDEIDLLRLSSSSPAGGW